MKAARPGLHPPAVWCFILVWLTVLASSAMAQSASTRQAMPATAGKPPAPLTSADLETFFDIIIPLQLERGDIAGAVVSVVKDGRVLFEKGYGYADVKAKRRVSPTETLFRVASVSKVFTATAVMQLVEQGRLNLDRDVNDYLDFTIPSTFAEPITLRHLLTHTAGFEWRMKDFWVREPGQVLPMSRFIPAHLPRRVFAPGTVPAYSNLGMSLAGYIVERASGKPFEQYMEEHLFQPLDMQRASFRQPLPAHLAPLLSQVYQAAGKDAQPPEIIGGYQPAAALAATGHDMARFMLAHLQQGRLDGAQILRPETAALMHARQPTHQPGLNGMALGFYEESSNGHRILGHSGDTMWFHSDLHLVPDANLGFFVSYNSEGGGRGMRGALWTKFLDRYFPYEPSKPSKLSGLRDEARQAAGSYITTEACRACPMHMISLVSQIHFSEDGRGNLVSSAMGGPFSLRKRFEPVAPLVFREVDGQELIAFRRTPDGQMIFLPDKPVMASYRARWYQNQKLIMLITLAPGLIFAATLFLWPLAALVRRRYKQPFPLQGVDRRLHYAVRAVSALNLAVLGLWALWASRGFLKAFNSTYDGYLHLVQVLTLVSLFASAVPLWPMLRAWGRRSTGWLHRISSTGVALACIGYVCFVMTAHLLDWSLGY